MKGRLSVTICVILINFYCVYSSRGDEDIKIEQLTNSTDSEIKEHKSSDACISSVGPGSGTTLRFVLSHRTWNQARQACILQGGHLAVLLTAAEYDAARKILLENSVEQAWLGLHDQFQFRDWVTVLDEPLDAYCVAAWQKGEPNNSDDNEHCVSFRDNAMNDAPCSYAFPFFCRV